MERPEASGRRNTFQAQSVGNIHDVVFAGGQGPRGRSEFGSAAQEGLDDGRVAAADGPVQRPHAVQVHVFQHGALLQKNLHHTHTHTHTPRLVRVSSK